MLIKLLKFGVVGFSGFIIDFGITYLLKEYAKWNKFVANAIGFICAVINNYLLNKVWTFHDTNDHMATQFLLFGIISLVGLSEMKINALNYWGNRLKKKMSFSFE